MVEGWNVGTLERGGWMESFGEWWQRTPAEEREAQVAAWRDAEARWRAWRARTVACVACQGRGWNWRYGRSYAEVLREECEVCGGVGRVEKEQEAER